MRRSLAAVIATLVALGVLAASVGAATPTSAPPLFEAGRSVYDIDGVLRATTERSLESVADSLTQASGIPLALIASRAGDQQTAEGTEAQAGAFATEFGPRGVVFLLAVDASTCAGHAAFARGADLTSPQLSDAVLDAIVADRVLPTLAGCDPDTAVIVALNAVSGPLIRAGIALGAAETATPASSAGESPGGSPAASPRPSASARPGGAPESPLPAGPPFPDPEPGRYVYDNAGVFSAATIATVQATIEEIRARTGAEIAVYSQVVDYGISTDEAERHARALMDQWGVGRRGFDDGLVILFDLDPSLVHGQVQLYAGPGYRATFLSNNERQAIFENEMLPFLEREDLDGALLVAMERIDANATPEHAATLARGRTINAIIGLVGTPLVFLLLVVWAGWSWFRYGRDPYYLDDPSILMPAPPPDLTAAAGALVMDGRSSRLTLTTALLDLASRDEIAFRPEDRRFQKDRLAIEIREPDERDAQIGLNRRKPISPAEAYALERLKSLAEEKDGVRVVEPDDLLKFGQHVGSFDTRLESYVKRMGWYRESPKKAVQRWQAIAIVELVAGIIAIAGGFTLPADGLVLLGSGVIGAALVTFAIATWMPARTMQGAVIRAMLAAYRRTLQKTMEMSRSMNQVVESKAVPWLETPDQAVVWGVAMGLRKEVEEVLDRTLSDLRKGVAMGATYIPHWYGSGAGFSAGEGSGFSGIAPGVFSGSAIPDFGNMMSVIGTVGNSPSSSGGGGYGGGGSGGGGGGSGGGF
jgi:uncharacterized membrane protein YgcG